MFKKLLNSTIAKEFAIYTSFSVIQKMIPFLLLPFLSRIFSEDELGYYVLFQTIIQLAMPLMTLSLDSAIGVNYYHLQKKDFAIYITNALLFVALLSVIIFGFTCVFSNYLELVLKFPAKWLLIGLLSIFPQFLYNTQQSLLRIFRKALSYGVLAILMSVLTNGIGLILLYTTGLTWEAFVIGVTVGYFIMGLLSINFMYKNQLWHFKYTKTYIVDAIKIGFPVSLHVIGSWLSSSLNKLLLNTLIGIAATASFSIGSMFGMIMSLLQDSMNLAWVPFLNEKLKENTTNSKQTLVRVTMIAYTGLIVSAVCISLIGYWGVGLIFGQLYISTRNFIIPMVLVSLLNGFYKLHVGYLFYFKKTATIAKVTLLSGVFNIGFSYIMILFFDIMGAVYASLFINCCVYLRILYKANQLYFMDWKNEVRQNLSLITLKNRMK